MKVATLKRRVLVDRETGCWLWAGPRNQHGYGRLPEGLVHRLMYELKVGPVPEGMVLDIGPGSIERIKAAIDEAATVVWNGPMGAFEMAPFDHGTVAIAKYVAERTKAGHIVSVAGGGDTVAALAHAGVKDQFTYVSTAGGAFLEWMEGKELPGVAVLSR